ncbi:hypothetical protein P692DRAFT_201806421 [Suillus brevipes Sb2]|nr:hypothetical protein P692DRAFT_201806421 [Suillus brevipes Sb2]
MDGPGVRGIYLGIENSVDMGRRWLGWLGLCKNMMGTPAEEFLVKGSLVPVKVVLKAIGSEGLWPQLVHCAPFPSIALYFTKARLSCPKVPDVYILEDSTGNNGDGNEKPVRISNGTEHKNNREAEA